MHILNVRETPVSTLLLNGNEFSSTVFVFIRLIIIADFDFSCFYYWKQ